ncbi:MAG: AI-2E family transporter YdiK [Planctomycetes bacterium]|nr:AI-2E family transporter YdiK [Planctomycetota bacterium]
MPAPTPPRDLTRTALAILFLVALLVTSFWILRPFLSSLIWAAMLVVATWPLFARLQNALLGRRALAVAVILLFLLLAFMLPVALALGLLIDHAPQLANWVSDLTREPLPAAPAWLDDLPLLGGWASRKWAELEALGPDGLRERLAPYAEGVARWSAVQLGSAGLLLVDFVLTLVLVGILYARGEVFAGGLRGFARRLGGEPGESVLLLAGQAVRAVALGVVVTALVQAAVGGLGLAVAGVPMAPVLTALMFVTSVAQIGAAPVPAFAAIWLFANGSSGWGIAMIVWTILVGSLDNVLRPMLIRAGVPLPLLLVFAGVIGGLLAFGPIGLFAGPVVLTVGHTLLLAWIDEAGRAVSIERV